MEAQGPAHEAQLQIMERFWEAYRFQVDTFRRVTGQHQDWSVPPWSELSDRQQRAFHELSPVFMKPLMTVTLLLEEMPS